MKISWDTSAGSLSLSLRNDYRPRGQIEPHLAHRAAVVIYSWLIDHLHFSEDASCRRSVRFDRDQNSRPRLYRAFMHPSAISSPHAVTSICLINRGMCPSKNWVKPHQASPVTSSRTLQICRLIPHVIRYTVDAHSTLFVEQSKLSSLFER